MYNLKLSNESYSIDICLKRKLTVVAGDSGTGKSFLCHAISQIQEGTNTPGKVLIVDNREVLSVAHNFTGDVLILDKIESYMVGDELARFLVKVPEKAYIIVFARSDIYIPDTAESFAWLIWNRDDRKYTCTLEYMFGGRL